MAESKVKIFVDGKVGDVGLSGNLDLYDNETILINRSIKDVQDVTKVRSDYTNTFQVPASKRNNRIFKHYYNTSLLNGWDNNIRISSMITLDGFTFKTGGVSIDSVQMEYSKPISYKITFYSKVVDIKSLVGEDTLQNLDLSKYDHSFNIETVALGMTAGLFNEDIIYPMFSNYSDWELNESTTHPGRYPWVVNLNTWTASTPSWTGIRHHQMKPAIKFTSIIDAIETDYGVTFSGDFFTSSDPDDNGKFEDLYLWTNHYKEELWNNEPYSIVERNYDILFYTQQSVPFGGTFELPGRIYKRFAATTDMSFRLIFSELPNGVYADLLINDISVETHIIFSGFTGSTIFGTHSIATNDEIRLRMRSYTSFLTFNISQWIGFESIPIPNISFDMSTDGTRTQDGVDFNLNMSYEMPPIKINDFLNSIIKMFNLLVQTDDGITYYFSKYNNFFTDTEVDISDYVFYDKYSVLEVDNFNDIRFLYQDNISNNPTSFKNTISRNFGDLIATLSIRTKKSFKIETPYSLPMTTKLVDYFNNQRIDVPVLKNFKGYEAGSIDGLTSSYTQIEGVEASDSIIIFYKNDNIDISTYSIGMTDAPYTEQSNGYTNLPIDNMFPSSPVRSFIDGSTQRYFTLTYSGDNEEYYGNINYDGVINQSLYKPNWSGYIGSIFNEKTRLFKFNAILPTRISNTLNLDNLVIINGKKYRINKLQTNLITGVSKFELINVI